MVFKGLSHLRFELRPIVLLFSLLRGHSTEKGLQNITHRNPYSTDTRLPAPFS